MNIQLHRGLACTMFLLLQILSVPLLSHANPLNLAYGDFLYEDNAASSVTIVRYTGSQGSVVVPDVIIGKPVTCIASGAFNNCLSVTNVAVGRNCTEIEPYAFYNCPSLNKFIIDSANQNFSSLEGVLFNKSQTILIHYPAGNTNASLVIPDHTLEITTPISSPFLTNVVIGAAVSGIDGSAFYENINLIGFKVSGSNPFYKSEGGILFNNLKTTLIKFPSAIGGTYSVPETVTNIGVMAFENSGLTEVTLGNVAVIDREAFSWCLRIGEIKLPNSVTDIGERAFSAGRGLTNVVIGKGTTNIGPAAFFYCTNLETFHLDPNNLWFCSIDGVLYNKNKTTLIQYPPSQTRSSFFIPESVTSLENFAFAYSIHLTNVVMPENLANVGSYAFLASGLSSIQIPNLVTNIGYMAFNSCDNLRNAVIGENVSTLGNGAFLGATNLTSVFFRGNIPEDLRDSVFSSNCRLKIFYKTGSSGWQSTFLGYPTATWRESPNLTIQKAGESVFLAWARGLLLETTTPENGPWTTNSLAKSPHVVTPNGRQQFYRLLME